MQNSLDALIEQLKDLKTQRIATFGVYSPSIKRLKTISETGYVSLCPEPNLDQTVRVTQHTSVNEAEAIMKKGGEIKKMMADGNCGYHAAKYIFQQMGRLPKNLSITDFRKMIFDYGKENINQFSGVDPVTGEEVQKYAFRNNAAENGFSVCNQRKSTRQSAKREYMFIL